MTSSQADLGIAQGRNAELERQLRLEISARKQLVDAAVRLNSTLDSKKLLQLILAMAADLLDAETSSLLLVDKETNELVIEVATGSVGRMVVQRRIPIGAGIAGWTLAHRQVVIIDDPQSDERFFAEVGGSIDFETRNLLALPLLVKDRAVGVVEVINKRNGRHFSEWDAELAGAFCALAAVAVDNANLYAELADAVVTARMSYRL
jgi:phosphoserine phosphatase RsbU/P